MSQDPQRPPTGQPTPHRGTWTPPGSVPPRGPGAPSATGAPGTGPWPPTGPAPSGPRPAAGTGPVRGRITPLIWVSLAFTVVHLLGSQVNIFLPALSSHWHLSSSAINVFYNGLTIVFGLIDLVALALAIAALVKDRTASRLWGGIAAGAAGASLAGIVFYYIVSIPARLLW